MFSFGFKATKPCDDSNVENYLCCAIMKLILKKFDISEELCARLFYLPKAMTSWCLCCLPCRLTPWHYCTWPRNNPAHNLIPTAVCCFFSSVSPFLRWANYLLAVASCLANTHEGVINLVIKFSAWKQIDVPLKQSLWRFFMDVKLSGI